MDRLLCVLILITFLASSGCRKKSEPPILSIGDDKVPMNFEPFSHISTLKPGKSTIKNATELLGSPISQEFYISSEGDTSKVWSEFDCGISIVTVGVLRDSTIIDAIVAEQNYKGKSRTGLALGVSKDEALKLINKKYMVKDFGSETVIFKLNENSTCTQLFFKENKVSAIKMYQ